MNLQPNSSLISVLRVLTIWLALPAVGLLPAFGRPSDAAAPVQEADAKNEEKKPSDKQDDKGKGKGQGKSDTKDAKRKGQAGRRGKTATPAQPTGMDPRLRQKIDAMLESAASRKKQEVKKGAGNVKQPNPRDRSPAGRNPRTPGTQVPTRPGSAGRGVVRTGQENAPGKESTKLDIPAVQSDVPPDERTYWFSIKDGTYQQLLDAFARMTGLGMIGEAPKDGKVSFVSTEELSFAEALARVQILLFKYKPHEPYWLLKHSTHLEVIRVNDIYRILPPELMFRSVEEFRAAGLGDNELALVIYTPKSGSVAQWRVVRDFMPDYVRVAPLGSNSITIFALVKDINKYFGLGKIFVFNNASNDPRTLERIEIEHILPSEALSKLERLMSFDGAKRPRTTVSRGRGKEASPLLPMVEPDVTLLPDDTQGVLIVRAMQDKIEEIKRLLPYIDVDVSVEGFEPVVIPVERADPDQLIAVIQKILSVGKQPAVTKSTKRSTTSRSKTSSRSARVTVTATGITLLAHPSEDAIIVIGDEEGTQRVRELIRRFDVADSVGPIRIAVSHADPAEIATTITTLLGGGAPRGPKAPPGRFTVVNVPGTDAIWFTGGKKQLEKVEDLLTILDVADRGTSLHVVTLRNQKASFVASFLREFDKNGGKAATPGKKARPARGGSIITASKFTPVDEQNRLFILCSDEEWEGYVPIIEQLEQAVEPGPPFVRLAVEHADPEAVVTRLGLLLPDLDKRGGPVRYAPTDGGILVIGADEVQLADIRAVLAEIDRPTQIVTRTFDIRHRDPTEIKGVVETLMTGTPTGKSKRRRPHPDAKRATPAVGLMPSELTIIQIGYSLVVRTTSGRMEEVAALIAELDVEETARELKIYGDFPPQADIVSISEALSTEFAGRKPRRPRKGPAPTASEGPRFFPQPSLGRIVVIADATMFVQIEQFLDTLRGEREIDPREIAFINVEFADPGALVEQIAPLLNMKISELVATGKLADAGLPRGGAAKSAARRAAQTDMSRYYHLAPDVRNARIVIAAPRIVIEEAQTLVSKFDKPVDDKEFRTVALKHADAATMVKTIKEMMGSSLRAPARRPSKAGAAALGSGSGPALTIAEAPGGGAVVLHGLEQEVARAVEWIEQLDAMSTSGRTIKIYEIKHVDVKMLGDLIVNTVEKPAVRPAAGRPPRPRKGMAALEEEDEFDLTKTWTTQDLYIQADLIAGTMLVSASDATLNQIDDIVAQLDTEESFGLSGGQVVPKRMFELKHVEAIDAEFELEMALEQLWDPPDELPQVEAAFFGNYLIVSYPHEDRFPEIEEIIRKYVDKPRPGELDIKTKGITAPSRMSATATALWIKMNHPELQVDIVDKTPKGDSVDIERLKPRQRTDHNPCVLPAALTRMVTDLLVSVAQAGPGDDPRDDDDKATPRPEGSTGQRGEGLLEEAVKSMLRDETPNPTQGTPDTELEANVGSADVGQKLTIEVDDTTGAVIIKGPAGVLEDIPEWIEELEKELEDVKRPPDIRIFRVQYIDVYSAAQIIEEMFNATRQQRQTVAAAQRRQQQIARQQQQQRQRQQQQQKQQGQQPGQPQRPGQRGQQPAAQANIPQLPEPAVRVYPNPRDRTLILRAETNQYPALMELLATIDQPQPIDSDLRIFKLDRLNAGEVEEVLKEMLGLGARSSGTSAAQPQRGQRGGRTPARRGTSGQLPKTVMQETVSGTNRLGVDAKDIKLSSNEASNTIVVMAPESALDFIGELIKKLESEEIPERHTRYYELTHAAVEEVAEHLETRFAESQPPGRRSKSGKGAPSSGVSLNTPSFIPYPRLNTLTVLATAEQLTQIDDIIDRIDVSGEEVAWKDVTLVHADAGKVADTLTQMFGSGAAPGRGNARGATSGPSNVRFIGEEGGRMLLYNAPEGLHEPILAMIEKLEVQAKGTTKIRIVKLDYATPSKVADAIRAAYGGATRGRPSGRGAGSARFTVTADDPSKQLFVQADDDMFKEIESLVKTLDKPAKLDIEFRIYPLKYANARQVHTTMTSLMTKYFQQLGRGGDREAFSVEVDERANALIVLAGSPAVFDFLEKNLATVDNPAYAVGPVSTLTVAMKNARAEEVAATINRLYGGKKPGSGETPPQAEANRSLNLLIVRGTESQIDEIRKEIIEPLEQHATAALSTETIQLEYADSEAVAEEINRIFEDRRQAHQAIAGRGGAVSPLEFTVVVTPQVSTKQVVVQASAENMKFVKARIAELDTEHVAANLATKVKIYAIKYADPDAVVRIINEWGRSLPKRGGGKRGGGGDVVNASSEPTTQSVVVTAGAANHLIIQELIDGLDAESTNVREVHTYKLAMADAQELSQGLQAVYRGRRSTGRGQQAVQITPERATNSLLIFANQTEMAELVTLIKTLDVEPDPARGQLVSIHLDYADPASVQDAIRQLFQAGGRDPRDRVAVVPEFGSNSVIVSASLQNMKRIEELIRSLDTEEGSRLDVHVINIENADAGSVAQMLTELFVRTARRTQGGQAPPISISALQGSKAVLVKCNTEDFAEIEAVVTQIDSEESVLGEEVRVVPLLYGDAAEVETSLRAYLQKPGGRGGRGGGELVGDIRVSVLGQSNALVISGDKNAVTRLEALAKRLDDAGEKGSVPQIIKLEYANAGQVALTLEEMFSKETRGGRRGQTPPVIIPNDETTLIVRAGPTDFAAIESLVEELDTKDAIGRKTFRIVQVGVGLNVRDAGEKVEEAINEGARAQGKGRRGGDVPSIRVTPDTRTQSLIVSGSPELFDQAEEMLRTLEKMGPPGGKAIKIITVVGTPMEEIERLIALLKGEESSKKGRSSRSGSRRSGSSSRRRGP